MNPNLQDWQPQPPETLEATWWILDREPGMDDIYDRAAADYFQKMIEDLGIHPFRDSGRNYRLFLARFELPKYQEAFQFPEAILEEVGDEARGFVDFLGGFPIEDCEMLLLIGQYSSIPDEVDVKESDGEKMVAPFPAKLFAWPDKQKILMNFTAITTGDSKYLAANLSGEDKPKHVHWWVRTNLRDTKDDVALRFPTPGEFFGLGIRMMVGKPWGHQLSSPFIWSGNWLDTVYYTSAEVKEVIPPDDDRPFNLYTVKWRKDPDDPNSTGEIQVIPSDFRDYAVGDRVTILKDVGTEKKSQLWKDDDMKTFGDNWQIVPITFYQEE
jgi:hypothetical protein